MIRPLLIAIAIQWCSLGYACSPFEWSHSGNAKTSNEYAKLLLSKASAVVLARVTSAATVIKSELNISGYAQIEMLERFKGPDNLRIIYTHVRFGNCDSPAFVEGEERLFVLVSTPPSEGDDKYFEVIAWQTPQFPQHELIAQMRTLSQSNCVFRTIVTAISGRT